MPEARTRAVTLADVPEVIHVGFNQGVVLEIDIPDIVRAEGTCARLAFGTARGIVGEHHGEGASDGKILIGDDFLNLLGNLFLPHLRAFCLLLRTLGLSAGALGKLPTHMLFAYRFLRLFFRFLFF